LPGCRIGRVVKRQATGVEGLFLHIPNPQSGIAARRGRNQTNFTAETLRHGENQNQRQTLYHRSRRKSREHGGDFLKNRMRNKRKSSRLDKNLTDSSAEETEEAEDRKRKPEIGT